MPPECRHPAALYRSALICYIEMRANIPLFALVLCVLCSAFGSPTGKRKSEVEVDALVGNKHPKLDTAPFRSDFFLSSDAVEKVLADSHPFPPVISFVSKSLNEFFYRIANRLALEQGLPLTIKEQKFSEFIGRDEQLLTILKLADKDEQEKIFLLAVEMEDTRVLAMLLNNQIVDPSIYNNAAICLAAKLGSVRVLDVLSSLGLDLSIQNEALKIATQNGHGAFARRLLYHIDLFSEFYFDSALYAAVNTNQTALALAYLRKSRSQVSLPFIIDAIRTESIPLLDEVLGRHSLSRRDISAMVRSATIKGNVEVFALILRHHYVSEQEIHESFFDAINHDHFGIVNHLLNLGYTPNENSIIAAASTGRLSILRRIIQLPRCQIPLYVERIFQFALIQDHTRIVDLIKPILIGYQKGPLYVYAASLLLKNPAQATTYLNSHPEIDISWRSYLFALASKYGSSEFVLTWASSVDPAVFNNLALRKASEHGHFNIVMLLLQCPGVDPTAMANEAIHQAAKNGYTDVVHFLSTLPGVIEQDRQILDLPFFIQDSFKSTQTSASNDPHTTLRIAATRGHVNMLRLLLSEMKGDEPEDNDIISQAFISALVHNQPECAEIIANERLNSINRGDIIDLLTFGIEQDRADILDFVDKHFWSLTVGQIEHFERVFEVAAKKGSLEYMQKLVGIMGLREGMVDEFDFLLPETGDLIGSLKKKVIEVAVKHGNLNLIDFLKGSKL